MMYERREKDKKIDKYGVNLDSGEYIDKARVASANDYTGMVPVAMHDESIEESYQAMFDVPVGDMNRKKSEDAKKAKTRAENLK